jgi:hypothetical protein
MVKEKIQKGAESEKPPSILDTITRCISTTGLLYRENRQLVAYGLIPNSGLRRRCINL